MTTPQQRIGAVVPGLLTPVPNTFRSDSRVLVARGAIGGGDVPTPDSVRAPTDRAPIPGQRGGMTSTAAARPAAIPLPRQGSSRPDPALPATSSPASAIARRLAATVRQTPLACVVVLAVLTAGAVTGTMFDAEAAAREPATDLAYGLPAFADGRWLSLLGGALLVPRPALYPVVAALLALAVGFLERRAGTARTAAVLVFTQVAGALGSAAALAVAAPMPWPWAHAVAVQTDTGLSAGAVGVLAAGSALAAPLWRARMRWIVGGYLAIMLLRSGLLWDLEHALAFVAGLAAGPVLRSAGATAAAPSAPRAPRLLRVRGTVALLVLLMPVGSLVLAAYPGYGGIFGPGTIQPPPPMVPALVQLAIALVIAKALRRGLPGAWWAAVVVCAVPLVRDLARVAVSWPHLATADIAGHAGDLLGWTGMLAVLVACRRCWPRRLPTPVLRRYVPRLLAATTAFAGVWWLVLTVAGPQFGVLPHDRGRAVLASVTFGGSAGADFPWVRFAVGLSGWIWAATLIALLMPMVLAVREGRRPDPVADARLVELVRTHGGGSLGWQRTWPGFSCWTTSAGDVAVSYRIVSGVALVLGDPVGPANRWPAAVAEFRRFCLRAGWTVCWYAVTPAFAEHCGDGWHLTQVGEDAVLDLDGLEFRGKSWQDVRTARNHAARAGIAMRRVAIADAPPELRAQIAEVSRGWTLSKPLPEMGFTLGTVDHARDGQMRTHIALDASGVVHGVTTWLPVHADGRIVGWTLDVMRRRIGGFRPVIEFLIAESALAFRAEGCRTLSLSVAPLARCAAAGSDGHRTTNGGDGLRGADPDRAPAAGTGGAPMGSVTGRLDSVLDKASRLLEPAYGFRSLLEFKRKFHPAFSPVYLGYADEIDLSQITVAIGKAYLPHLTARQACRIVRTLCRSRETGRRPTGQSRESAGATPRTPERRAPVS